MPDRSFVERLRSQGGPSHELLVLLDAHRVMTTDQLARASGAPERTVRYRLARLREHHLVDGHRPGREVGSSPSHWWLRPAGARLVTGAVPPADGRPSHPFVSHAAAISEAWLAVREHGPAAGVGLTGWLTDRAGWQEWDPPNVYAGTRRRRLTPDAVLTADVDHAGVAGGAAAFIEIDLATMTQTQLRERVARYATYAAERAWTDTFPHCPVLLVLTTTEARAVNFVRTVRRVLGEDRPRRAYGLDQLDVDAAADGELVVAACGLVRDPAQAITGPVWLLPEPAAAPLTLTELLAERVDVQARAAAARARAAAAAQALDRRDALDEVARRGVDDLTQLLGDARAGQALAVLTESPLRFLERDEPLAAAVAGWWGTRRVGRRPPGPPPAPLVDALRARHGHIWARHAGLVLAADDRVAADDPYLAGLAARLAAGLLLARADRDRLRQPPEADRAQLQAEALAGYTAARDVDVARAHQALPWLTRRRTDRAELAAAQDARHLLACDVCAMTVPRDDPDPEPGDRPRWTGYGDGDRCRYCGTGTLRGPVDPAGPGLTERLAILRALLDHSHGGR